MADLEPIGPMIPALPPRKRKEDRRKSGQGEKPDRDDGDRGSSVDERNPDEPTHQVDEYT